ncbi:MAG: hypothetical protein Q6373_024580 [Candidatus Sigynarchaeota archaeon]
MKGQTPREIKHRSLFWLFRRRLLYETRKYTPGIILTAGVTALFVAMLVVGSSFLSASYRAMGIKGPRIFDIKYPTESISIALEMPRAVNITCGVSDFYAVESVRLYYSIDFMKTSVPIEGKLFATNLSGQFYRFTIDYVLAESGIPEPLTYLFFIWANNSAGYFTHEDNGQSFFSIRLQEASGQGINYQDPSLLQAIQRVQIGIYNQTTTRDPRPTLSLWINQTSTAWVSINGNSSTQRSGARYYSFVPATNLNVGLNNITFFVQQNKLYSRTILVNRVDTPITLTSLKPGNGSTVYNSLRWINFTANDYIKCNVSLAGNFNKAWNISSYQKYFSFRVEFNKTFGNYSVDINAADNYGNTRYFTLHFTFQKSSEPYIYIFSPRNTSSLVNITIGINASFSEACNVTVENLNVTGSARSYLNITSGILGGMGLTRGWNYLNITATNVDGRVNSTILRVMQQPYIIHHFTFNPFAIPGGKLYVDLNFSTNYTASISGDLWYIFDYTPPYQHVLFSIINSTTSTGVRKGILRATINIPLYAEHVLFNFTVYFGPESKHYDQNGQDFHVPVAYLYQDLQGPVIREIRIAPSGRYFSTTTTISSNDKAKIRVNLFDVTGVKNASVMFSLNSTFDKNATLNMTYEGGSSNKNGYWYVVLPSQVNGSVVYCRIVLYDILNNTDYYSVQYQVTDRLNPYLYVGVIPGLLSPDFEEFVIGAITTLLVIMVLVIVVFIAIFISINDQNVKREMYREEDRIFILKHVCKLDREAISKYYYTEQLIQDSIGYGVGAMLGFLVLGPLFVAILKLTIIKWTIDFQDMFYFSFITLESWVILLLLLFVLCALLLKLVQVDKYVAKMVN